jgi:hypothetical protein
MMSHGLARAFCKIQYTQNLLLHVQTLPLAYVGTAIPGVEPDVSPKVGADIPFSTFVDAYTDLMQPLYGTDTAISTAEFWFMPTDTSDPIWIWTEAVGKAGTATTASADLLQSVMTFRTALGGLFRLYNMEISGEIPVNYRSVWPFSAGPYLNMANYLIGDSSPVIGRDDASLVVPIAFTTKYNDALRKKRGLV